MVKKFKTPEKCEECGAEIEEYFGLCRKCNLFFCYDCLKKHNMHDPVPCESLENNEAIIIELGEGGGYGPRSEGWVLLDLATFYSEYIKKCEHAKEYFQTNKHIFICHDCHQYVCLDCLDNHKGHSRMLEVVTDDMKLRQIDPNLYEANIELKPEVKIIEKSEINKFVVSVKLINENEKSVHDITVSYLNSLDGSTDTYSNLIHRIEELEPHNSYNFSYTITLPKEVIHPNNNIILGTEVVYHDIFGGMSSDIVFNNISESF